MSGKKYVTYDTADQALNWFYVYTDRWHHILVSIQQSQDISASLLYMVFKLGILLELGGSYNICHLQCPQHFASS
jgi:hypothetical protein